MADMTKRVVSHIKALTPEDITKQLIQVNFRTGRTTEVISIHKEGPFWIVFFYTFLEELVPAKEPVVKKKRRSKKAGK